jgi:hypothetical protein
MCGKKSTYTKVRGILHYLLGSSHVVSTEFGPGFMTRWFLAWTFDLRPRIDSPLAAKKSFAFEVAKPLLGSTRTLEPLSEIEQRVREYGESFPGCQMRIGTLSANGPSANHHGLLRVTLLPARGEISADQDGTLPEPLRRVLSTVPLERRLEWLPREGHFAVELAVRDPGWGGNGGVGPSSACHVSVTTIAHNKVGQAVVDKIQVQLESEINRSSRKWRRILQRMQTEPPQPPPTSSATQASSPPADAMDES